MPRLIRVFAGHTGHFVGFVMVWLKFESQCFVILKSVFCYLKVCVLLSYRVVIPARITSVAGSKVFTKLTRKMFQNYPAINCFLDNLSSSQGSILVITKMHTTVLILLLFCGKLYFFIM